MLKSFVHTPRFLLVAALTAVAAVGAAPAAAKADGFAMITIDNPTNSPLAYEFKWGADGDWEETVIMPHHYVNHWCALDEDGRAPRPYIRFHCNLYGPEVVEQSYRLKFYASYRKGYYQGKRYVLVEPGGILDLKEARRPPPTAPE